MNKKIRKLAKQSGFVVWPKSYLPDHMVDWGCNYDQELVAFAHAIVERVRDKIVELEQARNGITLETLQAYEDIYQMLDSVIDAQTPANENKGIDW